jgi:hypothetical protein
VDFWLSNVFQMYSPGWPVLFLGAVWMMPLILGGPMHAMALVFHGHKQTTTLSVYVKTTSAFSPIVPPNPHCSVS